MKPKVLVRTDFSAKAHLDPSPAQIAKREARKQRKEQVRQTRKDKQEKSETQRSNRTTNIEVNRLRRELHEARLREEQLHRDRIMPLNERLTALENEIARLRNQIIERDRVIHMDEQIKRKHIDTLAKIERLQTFKEESKAKIQRLRNELATEKLIHSNVAELENTVKRLEARISQADKNNTVLHERVNRQSRPTGPELIQLLEEFSLCDISPGVRWHMARTLRRMLSLLLKPKQDTAVQRSHQDAFGYLETLSPVPMVRLLGGATYVVTNVQRFPSIEVGQPIRVSVDNMLAVINRVYPVSRMGVRQHAHGTRKVRSRYGRNLFELPPLPAACKVLVIGGVKRVQRYSETLILLGADVIVHNGYDDGEHRLTSRAGWADVVVVCAGHTPHHVVEILDRHDPKVQLLKPGRDSTFTVVHRVRWFLVNRHANY